MFHVEGTREPAAMLEAKNVRDLREVQSAWLAGTGAGVVRSKDRGRTWQCVGATGRAVWQIGASPSEETALFAVTQPAAVFRSADAGQTWQAVDAFTRAPGAERWCLPTTPPEAARARTIVVDRHDPLRWWVGIEVGGVVATPDAGLTWTVHLPGGNPDLHVLVEHPAQRGQLFASTGFGRFDGVAAKVEGNAGVFRSDDAGRVWQNVWSGMTPLYTRPMCIDLRPPHALTVSCAPTAESSHSDPGGAQAMLYRSEDGGRTWRSLCDPPHSPSPANFHAVTPAPDAAGAVLVGTDTGEVWHVSEGGAWTRLASGLPTVLSVLPLDSTL